MKAFRSYEDQGVTFKLNGKEESLDKIAKTCVIKERGSYMGDFVENDAGELTEINFDKIDF